MTAPVSETIPGVGDFAAEWDAWHRRQEARLADPHGFLAITSLHWLTGEPQRIPDAPGAWRTGPGGVVVDLADGEELVIDGTPARGRRSFGVIPERGGVNAVWGDAVIEVAKRGGNDIVRPRHPDNVEFTLDGYAVSLTAFPGHEPGSLFVLFTDATSGVTTYAANRALQLPAPAADGTVALDFNRAANLPCAYTDLATCPLPPAGNRLPVAVEAGEKIPYERG